MFARQPEWKKQDVDSLRDQQVPGVKCKSNTCITNNKRRVKAYHTITAGKSAITYVVYF